MTVHHVGSADIGTVDVDAVGAVAAHARADSGIISLNPQDGLFLRAEHLQRMQDYARDLAAAVGVSAGSGVVYGYSVALGADELQVGTGFAVDGAGRPLRSRQAVTLPLADLVHAEDRFWVLEVTAAPPRPFGKENTYGTICDDPCAASALRPWLADGVTIRLVADTMPDLDRNPESSSRRNRLASWYFERERRRGGPWLTPTAPGATVSSILQRDWAAGTDAPSGDAVPLAVLARSDGEWLLDVWTARRDIGDPHPRRAWQARLAMRPWDVFVAQVLQFQAQLAATFGSSARSSAATRSSREADELVETLIDEVLSMAIRSKKVTAAARAVRDRKSVSAVLGSPLPELGLHELPPAGFLVDGRPDDEDRLDLRAHYEAVFGGNVDVTVCGCSADAVPRMVESAQHLDRIPLGPADPRPHVLVLVPDVRADLEAVAAQAYGWVAFVRGRSLTCGDRESIEEENGPRDVGSGDVIESETTMEGAPVVTVMPRADGTNSPRARIAVPVHRRRRRVEGTSEEEAQRAAAGAGTGNAGSIGPDHDDHPALDGTRLHRDDSAAELTAALGADAVTIGCDIYLGAGAPELGTAAGRRLLAHELTHVVQQQRFGTRVQRFTAAERPLIANDLAAMMAVVTGLVATSSRSDGGVDMGALVRHAGGRTATAALPQAIRSDEPRLPPLLTLRYLFTRRAGLIDMRHFLQLMYVSWFANTGNSAMAARGATKRGVEHERTAEPTSRFGPEDLTSNALGAWTATRLAGFPQRDDVISRIRETLQRCAPVDFAALSPVSQTAVVGFYAAQSGAGEPLNQNTTAVALVPSVPELAGTDRSFPFTLDDDDPRRATIGEPAFAGGAAGLIGDSEIRDFTATQRPEVIREIPIATKIRLGARLLKGWVSDDDLAAFERLFRLADPTERAAMRAAIAGVSLSGSQNTELRAILMLP